jgi:hypothetical protein
MPTPLHGGCFCGSVRYRVTQEPLTLYACHCSDCQRHTGGSFALIMIVARGGFEVLEGEASEYALTFPNGLQKHGRFCAKCGTLVWGEAVEFPQIVGVRPGTLDDTAWLNPIAHIWTRSAQPWVPIPPDTLTFETQPEDWMTLVKAWQQRQEES